MDGKTVASPQGSCTDRFAQAAFKQRGVEPASLPEPEHRGDHHQLPGGQARCGGDLGADRLEAGRSAASPDGSPAARTSTRWMAAS